MFIQLLFWFIYDCGKSKAKIKIKTKTRRLYIHFNFVLFVWSESVRNCSVLFQGITRCKNNPRFILKKRLVPQSCRIFDLAFSISTTFWKLLSRTTHVWSSIPQPLSKSFWNFVLYFVESTFRKPISRITHVWSSIPNQVLKSFRNLSCTLSGNCTS